MEQFLTGRKPGRGASKPASKPVDAAASDTTTNQAPVRTQRSRHRGQQSAESDAREEGETAEGDEQSSEEEDEGDTHAIDSASADLPAALHHSDDGADGLTGQLAAD